MASWHIEQLKYAAGFGALMSFYGIIGLIVWIGGTKLGLPINYQIVTIAVILLTLPFALIIGFVSSRRKKKAKAKEETAAQVEEKDSEGDKAQKLVAPTGNYSDIDKSAEEVVQFLKSSNLGVNGKEAVYSLPWYVVAGTPKSGKSSLVLGSNLNFQNLPSQRQSEQKFIRPTRNIDWRVTSDAVFVDTAGRYQSEGVDQDEWSSLLETIKKFRPKRPLDGFLLTVNLEKILNSTEPEVEQMAKVLRTRLDEAMQRIKVRFPVYLIFTNADSLEGFRDSFSTSKNEGKTLVWGSTIPLEKSENAQTLFDGEYEILQNSIMKRRLIRLSAPFPPVRQLRIFNFPLHFGSARRKVGSFVSTLFRPNPFSENPFLRGFYFTAAPLGSQRGKPGQTGANIPQTLGNTYFTERLFRDVILRDKDLVRTFQEQKQKPPVWGWILTSLGVLFVLALLVLAGVSLYNNKKLLDEASSRGEAVLTIVKSDAGKNPLEKSKDDAVREINATEALREDLAKLDNYYRNGAPYYLGMGLYSGNRLYYEDNGTSKSGLLPIYLSVIEQRYKNPTVERVKDDLKKFAASQPVVNPGKLSKQEEENLSRNYDLLKAYLMMTADYKDKAVASHITNTLKDYWIKESKVPAGQELIAQQQLDFWAKQVEQNKDLGSLLNVPYDKPLVDSVRKKLQLFPATFRYYKDQVTKISKQIDEKGTTSVPGILSANGGDTSYITGSYIVPGAYTLEGYKLMKTSISEANTKLGEENWVMGDQGKNDVAQSTDAGTIQDLYMRDYTDHWRNFVKGIDVKYDKQNAKEALQTLASANSPLKILLGEIAKNTNFSAKPQTQGWMEWISGFFSKLFSSSQVSTDTGGNTPVEKEFLPLFTFVGTPDKPNAPIDAYQTEIGRVANKYSGFSVSQINQISQDLAKDDDKQFTELRTAKTKIDGIANAVGTTPAGQDIASLLKEPLETLSSLLGADAKKQLAATWNEQLLPLAQKAESGFPFQATETDADLTNLNAYLNPVDGQLSKFYDERLKKYFDGNPGSLKLKENSEVKFSDEFVNYLNNAFRLRDALYVKNASPNFSYQFTLKPVSGGIIEGTIDGQSITSEGTESSKLLKFPADASSSGIGVYLKMVGSSESSSTSANNSASPVTSTSNTNSASPNKVAPNNSSNSSSAEIKKTGTWGLFKFFNAATSTKEPTGEYTLNFNIGGKTATAVIKPNGGDLFNKDLFTSVHAPANLLKP